MSEKRLTAFRFFANFVGERKDLKSLQVLSDTK